MKSSLKLGTVAGIPLFLHWTFFLSPAWTVLSGLMGGSSLVGIGVNLLFTAGVFGTVVLHELGHALAARRYGIQTQDIILMPIGGVARLERIPRNPFQELVVALAGPAVNVVLAAVLLAIAIPTLGAAGLLAPGNIAVELLAGMIAVNLIMIAFNLLPAFPMDGGRVLRSLLSMKWGHLRATRAAVKVARIMAITIAIAGLFWLDAPMLLFIAAFVYFGAAQELRVAEYEAMMQRAAAPFFYAPGSETDEPSEERRSGPVYYTDGRAASDGKVFMQVYFPRH